MRWPYNHNYLQILKMKAGSYIYFQSKLAPGKVIDISQNPNGYGNAVLYQYHKSPNQHFILIPCQEKGLFFIQSQMSPKVLTVNGHNNANGSLIVEEANTNKQAQKFRIEQVSQGLNEYNIFTFCQKAVDICQGKNKNETPIIQWQRHGQSNQIWKIRYV